MYAVFYNGFNSYIFIHYLESQNFRSEKMNDQYFGGLVLLFLLLLAMIGKNNSLAISVTGLLLIYLIGETGEGINEITNTILVFLDKYGLTIGVIILMMGVLAPFPLGKLTVKEATEIFKGYKGIIGVFAGILVAISGAKGGYLLQLEPTITTAVVIGTIFGIIIFKGYPVGPLIGSGVAYFMIYIVEALMKN